MTIFGHEHYTHVLIYANTKYNYGCLTPVSYGNEFPTLDRSCNIPTCK